MQYFGWPELVPWNLLATSVKSKNISDTLDNNKDIKWAKNSWLETDDINS